MSKPLVIAADAFTLVTSLMTESTLQTLEGDLGQKIGALRALEGTIGAGVVLYAQPNYQGASRIAAPGSYGAGSLFESARIAPGWMVSFFDAEGAPIGAPLTTDTPQVAFQVGTTFTVQDTGGGGGSGTPIDFTAQNAINRAQRRALEARRWLAALQRAATLETAAAAGATLLGDVDP